MSYPYQGMTPDEYQREALRTEHTPGFIETDDPKVQAAQVARVIHGAIGICTEAGELQDMIKKHLIYGKDFDPVNVMEECGDLLWYIALALDATGYTMEECMQRNIAKLRKRFPDKFTSEQALTRDLDAERAALEQREGAISIVMSDERQSELRKYFGVTDAPCGCTFLGQERLAVCSKHPLRAGA